MGDDFVCVCENRVIRVSLSLENDSGGWGFHLLSLCGHAVFNQSRRHDGGGQVEGRAGRQTWTRRSHDPQKSSNRSE